MIGQSNKRLSFSLKPICHVLRFRFTKHANLEIILIQSSWRTHFHII